MKVKLNGGIIPTRAHSSDAGYDLYAIESVTIAPGKSHTFDTGVCLEIPWGFVGFVKSKSGLNVRHGLTSEGVIDSGYIGSIKVKLYNHGTDPYHVNYGDKISQIVILPIYTPELELVETLEPTERGDKGFGSTGR